jgi:serine/threonine-protein kinase
MNKYARWFTLFMAAVMVTALSAIFSFMYMSKVIKVEVPDLEARSMRDATRMLNTLGLNLSVKEEVFDVFVPKGHILEQDIPPGTYVENDTSVQVLLSKGPEVRLIPSFIGMSVDEVKEIIVAERLELDEFIQVHSATVREGTIIAQDPDPDEWTGGTITLIVSDGPYKATYYCPDFSGMMRDDALFLARQLRLTVVQRERDNPIVVAQSPPPGEELEEGSTVTLRFGG